MTRKLKQRIYKHWQLLLGSLVVALLVVALVLVARLPDDSKPKGLSLDGGSARVFSGAQSRASTSGWLKRHELIVQRAAAQNPQIVWLGDSITQGWEYHTALQKRYFPKYRMLNAGIASDRVEHILWRVEHGVFAVARPELVVLLAGVNNIGVQTPEEIAAKQLQLIRAIKQRSPKSHILLLGVLPMGARSDTRARMQIARLNTLLSPLGAIDGVSFKDVGHVLLEADGSIQRSVLYDYLHPTSLGYERLARSLRLEIRTRMQWIVAQRQQEVSAQAAKTAGPGQGALK